MFVLYTWGEFTLIKEAKSIFSVKAVPNLYFVPTHSDQAQNSQQGRTELRDQDQDNIPNVLFSGKDQCDHKPRHNRQLCLI